MKLRILFATALAVGMSTIASHSREAPVVTAAVVEKDKAVKEKAEAKSQKKAVELSEIRDPVVRRMLDTDAATAKRVDPITTSSTATAKAKSAGKKSGAPYSAIVARYAAEYGVPVPLAHAVIRVESNYRPSARGRAGEIGLMQIKPATARMMGYRGSAKGLYNPETNIKYGMKYLGKAHQLGGGSTCGTILKYNAGHGAKRMNRISSAYCAKVKRYLGV